MRTMIIDMIPENFEELLESYLAEQPAGELSEILGAVPEARLTQVLRTHGARLGRVYATSWERLENYVQESRLELFSDDFTESRQVLKEDYLSLFPEQGERRPLIPTTLAMQVARFEDAVLMTDRQRIYREVKDPDVLNFLLGDSLRVNRFDCTATVMDTEEFPSVWSPSIDTDLFRLAAKVVIEGNKLTQVKNAAEIGYASGAIARYLTDKLDIKHMLLAELNPDARKCAEQVFTGTGAGLEFYDGDGIEAMEQVTSQGTRFDLIACNPPYLPRPAINATGEDNAMHFEGTELFTALITKAPRYLTDGGRLIINVSTLALNALDKADRAARDAGLERRLLFTKRVPVKIYEFLTDEGWQDSLEKNGVLERLDGYVWQTLMFLEYRLP